MRHCLRLAGIVGLVALLCAPSSALAQTAPSLGAAQSFAVLGGSTVTNTGSTVISGDLGVSPGSAVTGFPPGTVVSGAIHSADAAALAGQNAVITAYNALASQPCTQNLIDPELGGLTLTAGVYCLSSTAQITGTLTLDAQGDPNAVFIIKVGTAITTASSSSVLLINNASPCNVFWQVGSSATLGTNSLLAGNILAMTSITLTTNARVTGRALARNGAVTLDSNQITASCAVIIPPPPCPPITLTPATLATGKVAVAYNQALAGNGGTAPYSFVVTSGTLPPGLTLSRTGGVTGTPTAAGSFPFTISGTDANACSISPVYSITVTATTPPPAGCAAITLTPTTLPTGVVGVAYSQTLAATGGTEPYSFGITAGAPPAGVTMTAAGVLSGTPTTAGQSTFTVRVTDAPGCFAELPYTLSIPTDVPTLPQAFLALLALTLLAGGYLRLQRRTPGHR